MAGKYITAGPDDDWDTIASRYRSNIQDLIRKNPHVTGSLTPGSFVYVPDSASSMSPGPGNLDTTQFNPDPDDDGGYNPPSPGSTVYAGGGGLGGGIGSGGEGGGGEDPYPTGFETGYKTATPKPHWTGQGTYMPAPGQGEQGGGEGGVGGSAMPQFSGTPAPPPTTTRSGTPVPTPSGTSRWATPTATPTWADFKKTEYAGKQTQEGPVPSATGTPTPYNTLTPIGTMPIKNSLLGTVMGEYGIIPSSDPTPKDPALLAQMDKIRAENELAAQQAKFVRAQYIVDLETQKQTVWADNPPMQFVLTILQAGAIDQTVVWGAYVGTGMALLNKASRVSAHAILPSVVGWQGDAVSFWQELAKNDAKLPAFDAETGKYGIVGFKNGNLTQMPPQALQGMNTLYGGSATATVNQQYSNPINPKDRNMFEKFWTVVHKPDGTTDWNLLFGKYNPGVDIFGTVMSMEGMSDWAWQFTVEPDKLDNLLKILNTMPSETRADARWIALQASTGREPVEGVPDLKYIKPITLDFAGTGLPIIKEWGNIELGIDWGDAVDFIMTTIADPVNVIDVLIPGIKLGAKVGGRGVKIGDTLTRVLMPGVSEASELLFMGSMEALMKGKHVLMQGQIATTRAIMNSMAKSNGALGNFIFGVSARSMQRTYTNNVRLAMDTLAQKFVEGDPLIKETDVDTFFENRMASALLGAEDTALDVLGPGMKTQFKDAVARLAESSTEGTDLLKIDELLKRYGSYSGLDAKSIDDLEVMLKDSKHLSDTDRPEVIAHLITNAVSDQYARELGIDLNRKGTLASWMGWLGGTYRQTVLSFNLRYMFGNGTDNFMKTILFGYTPAFKEAAGNLVTKYGTAIPSDIVQTFVDDVLSTRGTVPNSADMPWPVGTPEGTEKTWKWATGMNMPTVLSKAFNGDNPLASLLRNVNFSKIQQISMAASSSIERIARINIFKQAVETFIEKELRPEILGFIDSDPNAPAVLAGLYNAIQNGQINSATDIRKWILKNADPIKPLPTIDLHAMEPVGSPHNNVTIAVGEKITRIYNAQTIAQMEPEELAGAVGKIFDDALHTADQMYRQSTIGIKQATEVPLEMFRRIADYAPANFDLLPSALQHDIDFNELMSHGEVPFIIDTAGRFEYGHSIEAALNKVGLGGNTTKVYTTGYLRMVDNNIVIVLEDGVSLSVFGQRRAESMGLQVYHESDILNLNTQSGIQQQIPGPAATGGVPPSPFGTDQPVSLQGAPAPGAITGNKDLLMARQEVYNEQVAAYQEATGRSEMPSFPAVLDPNGAKRVKIQIERAASAGIPPHDAFLSALFPADADVDIIRDIAQGFIDKNMTPAQVFDIARQRYNELYYSGGGGYSAATRITGTGTGLREALPGVAPVGGPVTQLLDDAREMINRLPEDIKPVFDKLLRDFTVDERTGLLSPAALTSRLELETNPVVLYVDVQGLRELNASAVGDRLGDAAIAKLSEVSRGFGGPENTYAVGSGGKIAIVCSSEAQALQFGQSITQRFANETIGVLDETTNQTRNFQGAGNLFGIGRDVETARQDLVQRRSAFRQPSVRETDPTGAIGASVNAQVASGPSGYTESLRGLGTLSGSDYAVARELWEGVYLDPRTKLGSRRYFNERFAELQQLHGPDNVRVVKIDGAKLGTFWNTISIEAGDAYLATIANVLKKFPDSSRINSMGDEFAIPIVGDIGAFSDMFGTALAQHRFSIRDSEGGIHTFWDMKANVGVGYDLTTADRNLVYMKKTIPIQTPAQMEYVPLGQATTRGGGFVADQGVPFANMDGTTTYVPDVARMINQDTQGKDIRGSWNSVTGAWEWSFDMHPEKSSTTIWLSVDEPGVAKLEFRSSKGMDRTDLELAVTRLKEMGVDPGTMLKAGTQSDVRIETTTIAELLGGKKATAVVNKLPTYTGELPALWEDFTYTDMLKVLEGQGTIDIDNIIREFNAAGGDFSVECVLAGTTINEVRDWFRTAHPVEAQIAISQYGGIPADIVRGRRSILPDVTARAKDFFAKTFAPRQEALPPRTWLNQHNMNQSPGHALGAKGEDIDVVKHIASWQGAEKTEAIIMADALGLSLVDFVDTQVADWLSFLPPDDGFWVLRDGLLELWGDEDRASVMMAGLRARGLLPDLNMSSEQFLDKIIELQPEMDMWFTRVSEHADDILKAVWSPAEKSWIWDYEMHPRGEGTEFALTVTGRNSILIEEDGDMLVDSPEFMDTLQGLKAMGIPGNTKIRTTTGSYVEPVTLDRALGIFSGEKKVQGVSWRDGTINIIRTLEDDDPGTADLLEFMENGSGRGIYKQGEWFFGFAEMHMDLNETVNRFIGERDFPGRPDLYANTGWEAQIQGYRNGLEILDEDGGYDTTVAKRDLLASLLDVGFPADTMVSDFLFSDVRGSSANSVNLGQLHNRIAGLADGNIDVLVKAEITTILDKYGIVPVDVRPTMTVGADNTLDFVIILPTIKDPPLHGIYEGIQKGSPSWAGAQTGLVRFEFTSGVSETVTYAVTLNSPDPIIHGLKPRTEWEGGGGSMYMATDGGVVTAEILGQHLTETPPQEFLDNYSALIDADGLDGLAEAQSQWMVLKACKEMDSFAHGDISHMGMNDNEAYTMLTPFTTVEELYEKMAIRRYREAATAMLHLGSSGYLSQGKITFREDLTFVLQGGQKVVVPYEVWDTWLYAGDSSRMVTPIVKIESVSAMRSNLHIREDLVSILRTFREDSAWTNKQIGRVLDGFDEAGFTVTKQDIANMGLGEEAYSIIVANWDNMAANLGISPTEMKLAPSYLKGFKESVSDEAMRSYIYNKYTDIKDSLSRPSSSTVSYIRIEQYFPDKGWKTMLVPSTDESIKAALSNTEDLYGRPLVTRDYNSLTGGYKLHIPSEDAVNTNFEAIIEAIETQQRTNGPGTERVICPALFPREYEHVSLDTAKTRIRIWNQGIKDAGMVTLPGGQRVGIAAFDDTVDNFWNDYDGKELLENIESPVTYVFENTTGRMGMWEWTETKEDAQGVLADAFGNRGEIDVRIRSGAVSLANLSGADEGRAYSTMANERTSDGTMRLIYHSEYYPGMPGNVAKDLLSHGIDPEMKVVSYDEDGVVKYEATLDELATNPNRFKVYAPTKVDGMEMSLFHEMIVSEPDFAFSYHPNSGRIIPGKGGVHQNDQMTKIHPLKEWLNVRKTSDGYFVEDPEGGSSKTYVEDLANFLRNIGEHVDKGIRTNTWHATVQEAIDGQLHGVDITPSQSSIRHQNGIHDNYINPTQEELTALLDQLGNPLTPTKWYGLWTPAPDGMGPGRLVWSDQVMGHGQLLGYTGAGSQAGGVSIRLIQGGGKPLIIPADTYSNVELVARTIQDMLGNRPEVAKIPITINTADLTLGPDMISGQPGYWVGTIAEVTGIGKVRREDMHTTMMDWMNSQNKLDQRASLLGQVNEEYAKTVDTLAEWKTRTTNSLAEGVGTHVASRDAFSDAIAKGERLAQEWQAGVEMGVSYGKSEVSRILFDYNQKSSLEELLRYYSPFSTWQLRNPALWAQILTQHPGLITLLYKIVNSMEQDQREANMTSRFKNTIMFNAQGGAIPRGMYGVNPAPFMSLSSQFQQPYQPPEGEDFASKQNDLQRFLSWLIQGGQSLGISPWPWVSKGAEMAGILPPGSTQWSLGPAQRAVELGLQATGNMEPGTGFIPNANQAWLKDYYIKRRIAELEAEGQITHEEALEALEQGMGPAYKMAVRDVEMQSMITTASSLVSPMTVKYASPGERIIRKTKAMVDEYKADPIAYGKLKDMYPYLKTYGYVMSSNEDSLAAEKVLRDYDVKMAPYKPWDREYRDMVAERADELYKIYGQSENRQKLMDMYVAVPVKDAGTTLFRLSTLEPRASEFKTPEGTIDWEKFDQEVERYYNNIEMLSAQVGKRTDLVGYLQYRYRNASAEEIGYSIYKKWASDAWDRLSDTAPNGRNFFDSVMWASEAQLMKDMAGGFTYEEAMKLRDDNIIKWNVQGIPWEFSSQLQTPYTKEQNLNQFVPAVAKIMKISSQEQAKIQKMYEDMNVIMPSIVKKQNETIVSRAKDQLYDYFYNLTPNEQKEVDRFLGKTNFDPSVLTDSELVSSWNQISNNLDLWYSINRGTFPVDERGFRKYVLPPNDGLNEEQKLELNRVRVDWYRYNQERNRGYVGSWTPLMEKYYGDPTGPKAIFWRDMNTIAIDSSTYDDPIMGPILNGVTRGTYDFTEDQYNKAHEYFLENKERFTDPIRTKSMREHPEWLLKAQGQRDEFNKTKMIAPEKLVDEYYALQDQDKADWRRMYPSRFKELTRYLVEEEARKINHPYYMYFYSSADYVKWFGSQAPSELNPKYVKDLANMWTGAVAAAMKYSDDPTQWNQLAMQLLGKTWFTRGITPPTQTPYPTKKGAEPKQPKVNPPPPPVIPRLP